ncbi:MAG: sigma-70 family RNA polymerase sigma factor [Gemmatimonadota bacterium]
MKISNSGAVSLSPRTESSGDDADAIDATLAASGDARAFERLYRKHLNRVHSLTRRMLGGEDTDEVTQDIFVRAWQKLGTFRGEAAFGTWLHRLAVNVILGRRASFGIRRKRFKDGPEVIELMPARSTRQELGRDFEAAMLKLPEGARKVFVLHDAEGYRHEEIAGMLGITVGTSKSQLHHARMAMRRHLNR